MKAWKLSHIKVINVNSRSKVKVKLFSFLQNWLKLTLFMAPKSILLVRYQSYVAYNYYSMKAWTWLNILVIWVIARSKVKVKLVNFLSKLVKIDTFLLICGIQLLLNGSLKLTSYPGHQGHFKVKGQGQIVKFSSKMA